MSYLELDTEALTKLETKKDFDRLLDDLEAEVYLVVGGEQKPRENVSRIVREIRKLLE